MTAAGLEHGGSEGPRQVDGVVLDTVDRAIADIAAGRAVVVVDDADRENEGDIIFAASKATPALLAFTIRHTSGVICVPMLGEELDRLQLPLMTAQNNERMRTAFTVSVDARDGVTTGISAADRARTVKVLVDSATEPYELVRPGHISPLIEYRRHTERMVRRVAETRLPNAYGEWHAFGYLNSVDGTEHVALVLGDLGDGEQVLTRVHSECLTGDVFGSQRCDCGAQLDAAMTAIAAEGRGAVLYLRGHEGRGIGLLSKLQA